MLPHAAGDVLEFLHSSLAAGWMDDGRLVRSTLLQNPSGMELPAECSGQLPPGAVIIEHTPLALPNYPYEWSPEMLRSAGELTLELALPFTRNPVGANAIRMPPSL